MMTVTIAILGPHTVGVSTGIRPHVTSVHTRTVSDIERLEVKQVMLQLVLGRRELELQRGVSQSTHNKPPN